MFNYIFIVLLFYCFIIILFYCYDGTDGTATGLALANDHWAFGPSSAEAPPLRIAEVLLEGGGAISVTAGGELRTQLVIAIRAPRQPAPGLIILRRGFGASAPKPRRSLLYKTIKQ